MRGGTFLSQSVGGTLKHPLTISCEENLLCTSRDPYNEDIYIHELAHGVHLVGGGAIKNFEVAVENAYDQAKRSGLWKQTYAISNSMEYFAEGVQSYFNFGQNGIEDIGPPTGNGNVNNINTRELLFGYDFQERFHSNAIEIES